MYEAALANPDTLADVADPDEDEMTCECYPAMDAWFRATGTARDEAGYDAYNAAWHAHPPAKRQRRGMGRRWDFDSDAQVGKRLPRLAKMYLDRD